MTPSDPDDLPTRHSGGLPERPQQPGAESGDDKTRPAGDAKPPQSPPTTPPAKAGAKAGKPAGAVDPMLGKVLGGCRLDRLLGRGAMGAVYQARQLKLDRDVAVKVIRAEMMNDQRTLARFRTEARIVGRFQSAHVVMVHDTGFELGVHFLVMELVQGKNLRDHVKLLAGGRLPAGEALPLLRQAIKGLEEAQRMQVVHRDIKPDNLMLTERGVLKIADFGIAKPLHEDFSMTLTSELVGTPLYMSPEQCRGQAEIDFRSDMYSLGATFYYLLTGEPPIRASSVYELIQTKTKLANLCLWKALPGLDENNPLSRVIERMTALDPNDRYPSYEALGNDLVLVEQGGTVHVPKAGTGGMSPQRGGRPASKPMWFGAAAVLALGVGGYAWYATRPAPAPTGGAGGDPGAVVVVDADAAARAAAEQLPSLRQRLQNEGPLPALREQLQALPVRGEAAVARDRLLADHAAGAALAARLAALTPPRELVPPFSALRAHVTAVDALLPLTGAPGPEVAAWAQRVVADARGERELLPAATARLTAAMMQWQRDRELQAGDGQTLVALGQRLEAIEAGRSTLLELWPAARAGLETDLPLTLLEAARQKLVAPARPADVDAGPALAEIRAEFLRSGPSAALGERTRSLQPTRAEQLQQRDQLLNELQRAEAARGLAEAARAQDFPAAPKLPFDDVDGYWQKVERALQPLRAADGALPAWAIAVRSQLRDEAALQPLVVEAVRAAFVARPRSGPGADAALATIEQAVARANQWFPGAASALAAAVPSTALQTARTELLQVGLAQGVRADADAFAQRLSALSTLADWLRSAPRCRADLAALGERAAPLAADAELGAQLARLRGQCDRWTAVEQRLREFDQKLGAGELGAAEALLTSGVVGDEGRAELLLAGELATACRAAFVRLDAGDLVGAEAQLVLAVGKQRGFGELLAAAGARVQRWSSALGKLRAATAGLVPIAGGRTKAAPQPVPAFYLAASECSRAEFAPFVEALRQLVAGIDEPQARLAKVAERCPGVGFTTEQLQELLDRDVSRNPDRTPVDNVGWHAAAAYAAFHGQVLPSAAEWALAAFGDGDRFEFPWGSSWSNDPEQRNPSNQQLAPVDQGGLSWRQQDGVRIHHLAGNVAEWLAADPAAPTAALAGGRYNDNSDTSVREQARGVLLTVDKVDARRGFGFRTALRIRDFPGLDWPR